MARVTSQGTCALCGHQSSKAGLTRHLKTCQARQGGKGKPEPLLHLRIESADIPLFWLDLDIKESAALRDLDSFLREIWLECCGHLSAFDIGGVTHDVTDGMTAKLGRVLAPGAVFAHEYDFGSSTHLKGKVQGALEGAIGRGPLRLIARNDAPVWPCRVCGGSASWIHTEEMWDSDAPFYCDAHQDAGEDDYLFLPVVNSPRMGVCGYEG